MGNHGWNEEALGESTRKLNVYKESWSLNEKVKKKLRRKKSLKELMMCTNVKHLDKLIKFVIWLVWSHSWFIFFSSIVVRYYSYFFILLFIIYSLLIGTFKKLYSILQKNLYITIMNLIWFIYKRWIIVIKLRYFIYS